MSIRRADAIAMLENHFKQFEVDTSLKKTKNYDTMCEEIMNSPTNFNIDLTDTNVKGKEKIYRTLEYIFENVIGKLEATQKFLVIFQTDTGYQSKTLTSELFQDLLSKFKSNALNYSSETVNSQKMIFSDSEAVHLPQIHWFKSFGIKPIIKQGTTNRSGSFWPYLNLTQLILDRYQIFQSLLGPDGKQRSELNDCCFVYALIQTGLFSEDTINKIRLRIRNRMLNQSKIRNICDEFQIQLILHYIDDESKQTSRKLTNRSKKAIPVEYKYTVEMNLYKGHYFLDERTQISSYYVNHIETEPYEKAEFHKNSAGRYCKPKKEEFWIKSGHLIRTLLEKKLFKEITFNEFSVLKTQFATEIQDIDCSLTFNPDFCTRKIVPPNFKKVEVYPKSVWFADFECDTQTNPEEHLPYMCVVENSVNQLDNVLQVPTVPNVFWTLCPTNPSFTFTILPTIFGCSHVTVFIMRSLKEQKLKPA
jgi:methionine salvage enolase-phosphatase E1